MAAQTASTPTNVTLPSLVSTQKEKKLALPRIIIPPRLKSGGIGVTTATTDAQGAGASSCGESKTPEGSGVPDVKTDAKMMQTEAEPETTSSSPSGETLHMSHCIIEGCANVLPPDSTAIICESCQRPPPQRSVSVPVRKPSVSSHPCKLCGTLVFTSTLREVYCAPCSSKLMPPPPGPFSSANASSSSSPSSGSGSRSRGRGRGIGRAMTPAPGGDETSPREEVPISRSRATIRLPARRVASQPLSQHPQPPPQAQSQTQPLQLGPFVQTQPLSMVPEAPLFSQPVQVQNQPSQLFPVPPHHRISQSFPWPPHRHFTDLVGLPHFNKNGEYIYPESIMISKESQSTVTPSLKVKIPPLPPNSPLRMRTPLGPENPISLPTLHSTSVQPSEPAITPSTSSAPSDSPQPSTPPPSKSPSTEQKCLNNQCRNRVPRTSTSFFCGKCSRISEESVFTASRGKEGSQGAPFRRLKPKDLSPVDVSSCVSIRISKSLKNAESPSHARTIEAGKETEKEKEKELSIPSPTSTPTPTSASMLPSPGKTIPAVSAGKDVSKFFFEIFPELRKDPNPSSRPSSPISSSPAPPSVIDLTDPRPDPLVTSNPDPGPDVESKQDGDGDGDVQMRDEDSSPSSSVSPPPRSSSIVGWDSDLSDLTPSEDEGEDVMDDDEEEDGSEQRPRLILRIPARHSLSRGLSSSKSAHICGMRECANLIAPDDTWRCCGICRKRARNRERWRTKGRRTSKENGALKMSEHPLDPNGRKCLRSDCDRLLPREEDYPWKACEACRQTPRSLKQAGQDQTRGITDITNNSAIPEKPTEDPKTLFPSYQDFGRLLQDFENRLRGFLFAQAHYLQVVKQSREKTAVEQGVSLEEVPDVALPMAFYFEGEFSIIADPSGGDMSERIVDAKKGIEGMIGTTLAPGGVSVSADGEILAWFSCSHELVVPSIPLAATPSKSITDPAVNAISEKEPTPSVQPTAEVAVKQEASSDHPPLESVAPESKADAKPAMDDTMSGQSLDVSPPSGSLEQSHSAQAIIKRMQGDLNILLSWDRRHRFFPGLRTVVRFQLVG